jgi:hypothetical protein
VFAKKPFIPQAGKTRQSNNLLDKKERERNYRFISTGVVRCDESPSWQLLLLLQFFLQRFPFSSRIHRRNMSYANT